MRTVIVAGVLLVAIVTSGCRAKQKTPDPAETENAAADLNADNKRNGMK